MLATRDNKAREPTWNNVGGKVCDKFSVTTALHSFKGRGTIPLIVVITRGLGASKCHSSE